MAGLWEHRTSPETTFGTGRTEPDMREELNKFFDGTWQEIPKKQPALLRKMRLDSDGNKTACPCVDSLTGEPDKDTFCPICLTGDSLIWTPDGLKRIEDILVNDRVIGSDSDYYKILDKQKFYTNQLITVKSRLRCDEIKMTPDHFMIVIKAEDYKKKHFILSEIPAKELKEKDLLIMPKPLIFNKLSSTAVDWKRYKKSRGVDSSEKLPAFLKLTDDFLWMMGLWIAEGSINGDRQLIFTLHIKESQLADRVEKVIKAISTDIGVSHTEKEDVNTRIISVYNAAFSRWIVDQCGHGCDKKHMPLFYQQLSPEQQMQLVKGLWEGDGCAIHYDSDRKTDRHSIGITAREVAHAAQITLWQNGFFAGLSTYQRSNRKKVYTLEWINEQYRATRGFFEFPDFWASQITSIESQQLHIVIPVYDITVEDNHAFVVNNTLSHNCHGDSWLWDETWVDVYMVELGSDIGKAIREDLIKPGLMNIPLMIFYMRSSVLVTRDDKIVEVVRGEDGQPVKPYKRLRLYRINAEIDLRSDNGRLEYWKLDCYAEERKFLNGLDG